MEQEPELEHSPLCQTIERDGIEIDVLIYRLTGDDLWHLEVVDEDNGSTVWDEQFADDNAALAEVRKVIAEEGIRTFFSDQNKTVH